MTVVDSLCVGQRVDSDEQVILFVKLLPGIRLSDELVKAIAREIRSRRSARHVPAKVS
jgi:acetoacetyl-CoA synthetase